MPFHSDCGDMKKHRERLGTLGSYYHIYCRGLDRKPLFLDDRDRLTFQLIVRDVIRDTGTRCYAFSLMDNHFHQFLRTLETPISRVMHRINLRYAHHHNRRHGGVGHVFQGRFQSVLIEGERHAKTALAYVHLNPVAAGIVADERALRDYPWTGHAAQMGRMHCDVVEVDGLLSWFGADRQAARQALSEFLAQADAAKTGFSHGPFDCYERHSEFTRLERRVADDLGLRDVRGVLGDSERVTRALSHRHSRHARQIRHAAAGWTSDRLLDAICTALGVRATAVRRGSRSRRHARARAVFVYLATRELGISSKSAGRMVSIRSGSVARARDRGEELAAVLALSHERVFGASLSADRVERERRES